MGLGLIAFCVVPASASVIVTPSNQFAPSLMPFFAPTYTVSGTDLINGKSPVASTGTFTQETSGGTPILTDGIFGTPLGLGDSANFASHSGLATTGGAGGGTSITYSLGNNALGYNINEIDIFGGWNDNGRDEQDFSVFYSTVSNPSTFIFLGSITDFLNAAGGVPISRQSATKVTLTETTSSPIATNAAFVKINWGTVESNYAGTTEIDVLGTAIPEPSSIGMLIAGALSLGLGRKRSRAN